MNLQWLKREKYIALNAQPRKFRIVKWAIFVMISCALFLWKGIVLVAFLWCLLILLGTTFHFLLRFKTNGWRKEWGPYKKVITTPFDNLVY